MEFSNACVLNTLYASQDRSVLGLAFVFFVHAIECLILIGQIKYKTNF